MDYRAVSVQGWSHLCLGIDRAHASQRVATIQPERSAEIFITAADSWQIYDRHLVNLRPPRADIYVLWTTVFASSSRTVAISTRDRKRACGEPIQSESTRRLPTGDGRPGSGGAGVADWGASESIPCWLVGEQTLLHSAAISWCAPAKAGSHQNIHITGDARNVNHKNTSQRCYRCRLPCWGSSTGQRRSQRVRPRPEPVQRLQL